MATRNFRPNTKPIKDKKLNAKLAVVAAEVRELFKEKRVKLPDPSRVRVVGTMLPAGVTRAVEQDDGHRYYTVLIPHAAIVDPDTDWMMYYVIHEMCHVAARHSTKGANVNGPDGHGHSKAFYKIFTKVSPARFHPWEAYYKPYSVKWGVKDSWTL